MARIMRKWTGWLFVVMAAAACAVLAYEYVGVDVWSEPPSAVSASGLVTGCERLDGGLLLAVEGGADDVVLLVDGLDDDAPLGYQIISLDGEVLVDGDGPCIPLSEWPEAAAVFVFALDETPMDAATGVLGVPLGTDLDAARGTDPAADATARRGVPLRAPDGGYPGLGGTFDVQVRIDEPTDGFTLLGLSAPGGSLSMDAIPEFSFDAPYFSNVCSVVATGGWFTPAVSGEYAFQVEADDDVGLYVGNVSAVSHFPDDTPGREARGWFRAGTRYGVSFIASSIGGPAKATVLKFAAATARTNRVGIAVTPHDVKFSRKTGEAASAAASIVGDPDPRCSYEIRCVRCDEGLVASGASAGVDFESSAWDGTNRTATATFALFEDGVQIDADSAVFTPLPEKAERCGCDCGEGTAADTGCVAFSQRFGRTPWIAGLPVGRLAIRETEPVGRLWTRSALVYDHPMCRRVALRRDASPLDVVILDPFGEGTEYRNGRPAEMSSGLARGIRYDADGLLVETLEDRMEITYNADGSVKSLKPADGLPVAVGDVGIRVLRERFSGAVTSVVSRADGRMDVETLSATSYRVTWRGPSGAVAKTFTFSGDGVSEFRLLERRGEELQFESAWSYDAAAQDWTFTKAPGTAAARTWAKSVVWDAANRAWTATRRTLDATGGVVRAESSVLDVSGRSIMETSRTVGGRELYFAARSASGAVASDVNSTGLETSYLYDGWNRVTNETATVKGGILRTTSWTYSDDEGDGGVVDRRPRRRTVVEDGVVVEDVETVYEPGRETRVRRAGAEERASFRELDERGRTTLSVDEAGRAVRTEYGPFDETDFSWSETRDEGVWTEADGFSTVDGRSTRRVIAYDASGNAASVHDYALVGGEWRETGWATNRYNAAHRLVSSVRSDGKSTSADWICTGPLWQVDEDGVATTNTFDAAKAMATSTRHGPHGAVTTAYERDAEGRVVRETETAEGCEARVRSRAYDEEGRVVSETDEHGLTTAYAYSADGRTTTVTLPSGGTRVTTVNPDGSLASITGTAVTPEFHTYGVTADGLRWEKTTYLSPGGARWERTYRNAFGEVVREERPGANGSTLVTERAYNAKGQLVSTTAAGRPTETRVYDAWGDVASTTLSADGRTRTVATDSSYALRDGEVWRVASRRVSCSDASIAPLVTTNAQQVSGLSPANESHGVAVDVRGNTTETWTTFDPATSTRLSYERVPEATNLALTETVDGVAVRRVSHSAVTNSVACDAYRRTVASIDGRGNATTNAYDSLGRLSRRIDPTGAVTAYAYDAAGRLAAVTNALGVATVYEYDVRGNKTYEGGGTYPVRYAYDAFNVMTNMTTFRGAGGPGSVPATGDTTTWIYDEATGLLLQKLHADGNGPSYTYTDSGNLATRTWARGVATTYAYDGWNSLTNTAYSDGTPSVSVAYDAMGRQTRAEDATGTTTFAYDAAGALAGETVQGLHSTVMVRHRDAYGRPVGHSIAGGRMTIVEYEAATARVRRVMSGSVWFTNSYLPGTDLRESVQYGSSGRTCYTYEAERDVLAQVRSEFGGATVSQYDYVTDAAGRRTEIARSGTAMSETRSDAYGYNDRNELTSAAKLGGPAAVPATTEYAYQYDDIGNRITSTDLGTNRTYTANFLNQYTLISNLCASVTLCDDFVPQYDLDGNQTLVKTSTGVWTVAYNGENRPVSWTCGTTNIVMAYDRMGRRVLSRETVGGVVTGRNHTFVYDGYLCLRRLDAATKKADMFFTWDPAESVATRLLMVERPGKYKMHVTHDGNKNVSELVFFSGGSGIAAHYEYAPFGAVTASTRSTSVTAYDFREYNPFRFSSEYADDTLGLVYYNYRHYNPLDGRWTSRDPMEEGSNGYSFIRNGYTIDILGLFMGEVVDFVVGGVVNTGKAIGEGVMAVGKAAGTGIKAISKGGYYTGKVVMNSVGLYFMIPVSLVDGEFINEAIYGDVMRGISFNDVSGCTISISVNGMANKDGGDFAKRLEDVWNQAAKPFHNPSNFAFPFPVGVGDVIQSMAYEIWLQDFASVGLSEVITRAYEKLKSNKCPEPCIKIYAHSQGTMITRRAFDFLKYSPVVSSKPLGSIAFCGYGGETAIYTSEFGLRTAENHINSEDLIRILPAHWGDYVDQVEKGHGGHPFVNYVK